MTGALMILIFMGLGLGLVLISLIVQKVTKKKLAYSIKNEGVVFGIVASFLVLAVLAGVLVFASNKVNADIEVSYFNYIELEAGLLYTSKVSPQCKPTSNYNKATSDLSATANLISFANDNRNIFVDLNYHYLHHSCELGEDRNDFDGHGPKARMRFNF